VLRGRCGIAILLGGQCHIACLAVRVRRRVRGGFGTG
jgi:hypothetical protein